VTAAIVTWSRRIILVLMLPLACLAGNVAPYLVGIVGIVLLVMLLVQRRLLGAYREPLAAMFLIAYLALGICFAITAEAPRDVLSVANFTLLLLAGPILFSLREGAAPGNAALIARLALIGVAVALVVVLVATLLGTERSAPITLGPIRLANTAVLFGFLALIGWFAESGRKRFVFLLGPPLGLLVTIVTQSRGPLLAFALLVPAALVFVVRKLERRTALLVVGGVVVVVVAAIGVIALQGRLAGVLRIPAAILSGDAVDTTTRIRLLFYETGLKAFAESPWIGHGWNDIMSAIQPFLTERQQTVLRFKHLHNDALDFAVAAGIAGLVIYLLLLATPIVAALRSPRDSQRELRIFGVTMLVVAYIGAGLTDLMFGFEFHTALYVCLAAVLIGYCRDGETTRP
jgi:O-antigen ligase